MQTQVDQLIKLGVLKPQSKKMQYLNIYRTKGGHLFPGGIFDSRELAVGYKSENASWVMVVEFEVVEGGDGK